jgi:pimeloyl-ACP methyl ester carboxylesterase
MEGNFMITITRLARRIAVALGVALAAAGAAQADGIIGTTFPADFPVNLDDSTGKPWIGFGAAGPVHRTPVIFLHGNNDTPFPTGNPAGSCSYSRHIQLMAQYFSDNGYSPSELWALGYQGDQCDLIDQFDLTLGSVVAGNPTNRSSAAHTNAASVPDLRNFVRAVRAYTGARQVDIVAHGMGVTLAREWVRQDAAERRVRRFVAIEGPNRGTIICSAAVDNPWASPFKGGYTPDSPVCQELGSHNTLFLARLNRTDHQVDAANTLVVRNTDASCLFILPDGLPCGPFGPTPSVDSFGKPTDFSTSARIPRAKELNLVGQAAYDDFTNGITAHWGIAYSPTTLRAAFSFLTRR